MTESAFRRLELRMSSPWDNSTESTPLLDRARNWRRALFRRLKRAKTRPRKRTNGSIDPRIDRSLDASIARFRGAIFQGFLYFESTVVRFLQFFQIVLYNKCVREVFRFQVHTYSDTFLWLLIRNRGSGY